ncbi:MAG: preprotein translocase subunit SecG [Proteobacteria bacterium]|nr:preprotein translocase subunit SecG [Pseudomonadota bacterium]
MESLIVFIHVVVCFLIILAVLFQGSNQDGMGATFGGGNSSSTFGAAGSTSLLAKLTYITATIFMITSICLTILQGAGYDIGLGDELEALSSDSSDPAAVETEVDQTTKEQPSAASQENQDQSP